MVYEIVSCPKRENPWERHPEDDEELYSEKEMNKGSGFIIGSEDANTDDLKVQVKLADGRSFEGVICAHDFHYNIAAMRFTSDSVVFCAPVKRLDDSLDLTRGSMMGNHFKFVVIPVHLNLPPAMP
ncbi:Transcription initiation factor IIB [Bienertia sinuspersici]